jgi:hypothetical protein
VITFYNHKNRVVEKQESIRKSVVDLFWLYCKIDVMRRFFCSVL